MVWKVLRGGGSTWCCSLTHQLPPVCGRLGLLRLHLASYTIHERVCCCMLHFQTRTHSHPQVPIVVAAYAGSPQLGPAVEAAVRAQQASDDAVAYGLAAARILEKVVLGSSVDEVRQKAGITHRANTCLCDGWLGARRLGSWAAGHGGWARRLGCWPRRRTPRNLRLHLSTF